MSMLKAALKKAEADLKESKRGSGRTHKMLQHALSTAMTGQTVFVIGQDEAHVKEMMNTVVGFPELAKLGPNVHISYQAGDIQLPNPMGRVQFRTKDHPDWSWDELRMRGYPYIVPNYVDHYVYEQKLLESQKGAKK